MDGATLAWIAVLIIFSVDAVLVFGLTTLKAIHRRRRRNHDRRRVGYVSVLSRHLAYENCTDLITAQDAEDPAFVDALIDVRNAVSGPESEMLHRIVDRYNVTARLIRRLSSWNSVGRRLRAAVALAELGDETSTSILMKHLTDHEPEVRVQAARGLGRMRWTAAIDTIVERFGEETPPVRARFADTLVGFGRDATWPLIAYITVNHRFESEGPIAAIRTLATIGDDQAVAPLIDLLGEAEDIEVRLTLVEALGHLANAEAAPMLRSLLAAEDWRVRAKVVTALGEVGDPQSIEPLADALTDRDWWVRRNSAAALARLPGGLTALYDALDSNDPYAADAAAEALADVGELAAARDRSTAGTATPGDHALLAHMAEAVA